MNFLQPITQQQRNRNLMDRRSITRNCYQGIVIPLLIISPVRTVKKLLVPFSVIVVSTPLAICVAHEAGACHQLQKIF